jgi:signal transduction histidine kinase
VTETAECSPAKILAVDDRPENLTAMRAALSDKDYELLCAASGAEALRLARENDFAVVLLDVQMPGMDGFEVARRLRQSERSRRTPIVFVTAIHRDESYESHGYDVGAVDYLFKPLNLSILRAKVAIFVELHRKNEEIRQHQILLRESAIRVKENELLREAIRARDEFLSIASHELKTPITPLSLQIQSFLQMSEDGRLPTAPPETLRRMLRNSYAQVERLEKLINDLLEASRLIEKRLRIEREPASLTQIVQSVLSDFATEITRARCEIRLDLAAGVTGLWDPFRLQQIVINLVTNALKYGPGAPIDIGVERRGERTARLTVRDHGIGIAPEDQERIFQRFERAVSALHFGGLGLGLFIVRQLVELHEGTVHVESALGQGATFIVELPCEPASAARREPA